MDLVELLRFCEKKTATSISIEVKHPAFYRCEKLKLAPDQYLHHSDFCRFAKLRDGNRSCSGNKSRSLEVARRGRCFSGCCPHGIWEYACPVMDADNLCAVIYFGNLLPENDAPELSPGVRTPQRVTEEKRRQIRRAASFIADFLKIELELFSAAGGMGGKQHDDEFYIENCRNFINCHYLENIALSDLADLLKVNPNYLGALIRRKTGSTFRTLLAQRRIEESTIYLKLHPALSGTKISRLCGFTDSNYFTTVFHQFCGVTPVEFKKGKGTAQDK